MGQNCHLLCEVIFYSGQRMRVPATGYRPDAVFTTARAPGYWGVTFTDLSAVKFDVPSPAEMSFTFQEAHSGEVEEGQTFQIMEGARQVGEGKIIAIQRNPPGQDGRSAL